MAGAPGSKALGACTGHGGLKVNRNQGNPNSTGRRSKAVGTGGCARGSQEQVGVGSTLLAHDKPTVAGSTCV